MGTFLISPGIARPVSHYQENLPKNPEGKFGSRLAFGQQTPPTPPEEGDQKSAAGKAAKQEPNKKETPWQRYARVTRQRFSSVDEFKKGLGEAYEITREDWVETWKSHSYPRLAVRFGLEALGLTLAAAFWWFPGPSPAWFVSPTIRKFGGTFFGGEKPEKPDKKPDAQPPDGSK